MTRELIIDELVARGYEVQSTDIVKNGVTLKGITIGTGNIRPTIYTEQFEDANNVDFVVDKIIEIYEESHKNIPLINTEELMNWDYTKTRLQLCIQKKGNENIVKRNFLDLEQYVRVYVSDDGSFKVTPEHLEKFGVSEDALFHAAWDCTKSTITETSMVEVLAEMMGVDADELEEQMIASGQMQIVVSNKNKVHGAVAICDTEMLTNIANKYESNLVILPSSIHECIVIPMEDIHLSELTAMVQDVNETQVDPAEQLSDHAYIFNKNTMEIIW